MIVIDTGPLVALFDPKDHDHRNCHKVLTKIHSSLFTTEAVLTEVLHMLDSGSKGAQGVMEFILQDYLTVRALTMEEIKYSFELMDKYSDLPMDFADATLMVLAEKINTEKVFTLNFNDFTTYRLKKGHRFYPFDLMGRELLE